jgi:8-oxo-dGTP pyrophosphatase MutT (NUDIX family)
MVNRVSPPFAEVIARLRHRLSQPLPGEAAMRLMSPLGRAFVPEAEALAGGAARAAALVLLYPAGARDTVHVALTARAPELRHHANQVSFPGGRIEMGEDIVTAALREVSEELAVPPDVLEVLGQLTTIYIPPSDFVVYPVVAVTPRRPHFAPNRAEVAELMEPAIDVFVGEGHRRTEWRTVRGEDRLVPYYAVAGHQVWGATSMMLAELAVVWQDAQADERASAEGRG